MASWSDATTAIIDKVEATLGEASALSPYYQQIPEGLGPDESYESYLRKGYGVVYGPAARELERTKSVIETRAYAIILTQEVAATSHDTDGRQEISQEMLVDSEALRAAFDGDRYLADSGTRKVTDIIWEGDSGIAFLPESEDKYYQLTIELTVKLLFT